MMGRNKALCAFGLLLAVARSGDACAFDTSLGNTLKTRFWLPFTRSGWNFAKADVERVHEDYAGMGASAADTPLARLRTAYQLDLASPITQPFDDAKYRAAVADARSDKTLSRAEREEVDLIDAKIDIRMHMPGDTEYLLRAKEKLERLLKTATASKMLSEARGWLAHVQLKLGDQTSAGKIYLDELNWQGSNLSQDIILNSIAEAYRPSRDPELLEHLEEYFDSPEHAVFAIEMLTNPADLPDGTRLPAPQPDSGQRAYRRIRQLLQERQALFAADAGGTLSLLGMRTALRAGDPSGAVAIAQMIPADAPVKAKPDFNWMLGSACFLSHNFAAAEAPLLSIVNSPGASEGRKADAAYGLIGVYRKLSNPIEEIRFGLVFRANTQAVTDEEIPDVAWPPNAFDLELLLDAEAPVPALQGFVSKYGSQEGADVVKYAFAVRLARLDRYTESAKLFELTAAKERTMRMLEMARLYRQAYLSGLSTEQSHKARYNLAEFLSQNDRKVYFNDSLWSGWQNYMLSGAEELGFTNAEGIAQVGLERRLRDDQEEYWRAYPILRTIVYDAGKTEMGRRAARLAIQCVRRISPRFGRRNEIVKADLELSRWLQEK